MVNICRFEPCVKLNALNMTKIALDKQRKRWYFSLTLVQFCHTPLWSALMGAKKGPATSRSRPGPGKVVRVPKVSIRPYPPGLTHFNQFVTTRAVCRLAATD